MCVAYVCSWLFWSQFVGLLCTSFSLIFLNKSWFVKFSSTYIHQKDKTQAEMSFSITTNTIGAWAPTIGPWAIGPPLRRLSFGQQLGPLEPRAIITTKRRRCGFSPASSILLPRLPSPSWAPCPTASDSRAYFSVERTPRACRLSLVKPLPTPAPAPRNHGSSSVWGTPGGCTKALGTT